jgi:hypothetical protein
MEDFVSLTLSLAAVRRPDKNVCHTQTLRNRIRAIGGLTGARYGVCIPMAMRTETEMATTMVDLRAESAGLRQRVKRRQYSKL